MAKNSSLFKKYVLTSIAVILISFSILGTMLLIFISNYWEAEKHDILEENATGIADFIERNVAGQESELYNLDSKFISGVLDAFSSNINADVFITDSKGNIVVLSSKAEKSMSVGQKVPIYILNATLNGGFSATDSLNSIYNTNHYIVSVPIMSTSDDGIPIGAVYTATDATYIVNFRIDVMKIFLIAALLSLGVSVILVGMMSYKMVRPLAQMSDAAISFGKGDFSKRVPIVRDDEIGKLACEFNNMAESLNISESARRSFVANVSHELKTPMTTIGGFVDGILDGTISNDKQNYYLKIVSAEVKRLSRLVTSMLNLSRIDNGELRLNKQNFDLTHVILTTVLSFEQQIEKKSIDILGLADIEKIYISGDSDLIHQVIYNLIENAVKFVNEKGYIYIEAAKGTSDVVIKIKNSGNGIASEEKNYIFDKFYKTDKSRSKDKNGMGLGLYIVKKIINMHSGKITVQSVEGEYCEFTITLPIDSPK